MTARDAIKAEIESHRSTYEVFVDAPLELEFEHTSGMMFFVMFNQFGNMFYADCSQRDDSRVTIINGEGRLERLLFKMRELNK